MTPSLIAVHADFDAIWPFAADHARALWERQGEVEFVRLAPGDGRMLSEVASHTAAVRRLVNFGVPLTADCAGSFSSLKEAALVTRIEPGIRDAFAARGVKLYQHKSEGFWGQSVAEFALALTICGLRRIPQLHHRMLTDATAWDYSPPGGVGQPGQRGQQFGDDPRFANGTIAGKRVRIVGAGNIGSRYASFCHALGADVAAWDPFASEPSFHRAGARREHHLDRLVLDAEIFAPMMPLVDATRGLVTARHIEMLPQGGLVVLVTRAAICDMNALRRRVLADELSLAADVFDIEPLPFTDPMLGRANVVHTPHNAGRTVHANHAFVEALLDQFTP
jgi:phosphoglycerate dehydrogenase-like enzyme